MWTLHTEIPYGYYVNWVVKLRGVSDRLNVSLFNEGIDFLAQLPVAELKKKTGIFCQPDRTQFHFPDFIHAAQHTRYGKII